MEIHDNENEKFTFSIKSGRVIRSMNSRAVFFRIFPKITTHFVGQSRKLITSKTIGLLSVCLVKRSLLKPGT